MKEIKLICKPLVAINGEIFDKAVVLYECQQDALRFFELTSKAEFDCKVTLQIDGHQAYFLNRSNEESQFLEVNLRSKEDLEVPIYVKKGNIRGTNSVIVKAITDYSSEVKKKIVIKTKKSTTPKLLFDFTYIDDDIYYIGEGERKVGRLTITAGKLEDCNNVEAYGALDITNLKCNSESICLKPLDNMIQTLSLGERSEYEVYFHYSKKGEVQFFFTLNNDTKSKKYTIKVKEPKDPIESMRFIPVSDLRYDSLKENHIVGYLNTCVVKTDKRGFLKRENGCFELTDRLHSFDSEGKSKKQVLEYGENSYPLYVSVEGILGSTRENIDEDKSINIQNLSYSDAITNNETIDAGYIVKHIEAHPSSRISIMDVSGNETIISGTEDHILEEWKYDSIHSSQVISANIFTINLSNDQRLPYNGNGILWQDINITGDEVVPQYIPRKEIRNGGDEFEIPIKVEFAKLLKKNEISVNFKCKEIINDCDAGEPAERQIDTTIKIPISEIVVDDWYSIDLGTTGIVVAKWCSANQDTFNNGISTVSLEDQGDQSIESSSNIVSSITILKQSPEDESVAEVVVAPSKTGLKQAAEFVLVPTKFMVGQNVIPFIKDYISRFPGGVKLGDQKYDWNDITPQDILTYTYKTIFTRISVDECNKIRKLIITYPNTYTPKSLDWLRNMIITSGIFSNLSIRNLHFIPESDSVVAFYINKSMMREHNPPSERVVIYDMGAGTLDLSYVKISIEQESNRRIKKSIIDRRIGLPIAGEYFSYLIYDQYKDKIDGTVNYTIKTWVEAFKAKYGTENKMKLRDVSIGESVINATFIEEPINLNEQTKRWIKICTEEALIQLLGEEWFNEVDRIVLSGRASQFHPIRALLKDLCDNRDIVFDIETITIEELKQCVAEGAILYQKIFENPSMPFSILHKNSYERIGIKYRILDECFTKKWVYKELMNESHLIWGDSPKDGAFFAHVPLLEINNLDFTLDEDVVFYLTTLNEEQMHQVINNPTDEREAFVHELFRFKPRVLTIAGNDRTKCNLTLSINSNNILNISIYSMDLLPHSTLPNVEDDKFYVKCNWYFSK